LDELADTRDRCYPIFCECLTGANLELAYSARYSRTQEKARDIFRRSKHRKRYDGYLAGLA